MVGKNKVLRYNRKAYVLYLHRAPSVYKFKISLSIVKKNNCKRKRTIGYLWNKESSTVCIRRMKDKIRLPLNTMAKWRTSMLVKQTVPWPNNPCKNDEHTFESYQPRCSQCPTQITH